MTLALLDDLLAAFAAPAAANAAIAANRQCSRGPAALPVACEGLRIAANLAPDDPEAWRNSQPFAPVRNTAIGLESKQRRGDSQVSQVSQRFVELGAVFDLSAVAWTDGDIARFHDRRDRLVRWGWPEIDAERLAARLVERDRDEDPRVSCTDCGNYRPGQCGNHRNAALLSAEIGRDLAGTLQRCPGYTERVQ